MYFQYGGYKHPDGEVNLVRMEIIPKFSERGERWAALKKLHIIGELQDTTQAAINTRITEIVNAYDVNDMTAGLYHDDGSPTRHVLEQNHPDNISGVKVAYRSWPRGAGDEYATVRTMHVIVQALFYEPDSEVLHFQESVRFIGDGSPRWEWVITPTGVPIQQVAAALTTQQIIQEGSIVGGSLYPLGNVPAPLFPQWEHRDRRIQDYHAARWFGNAYRHYGYSWRYFMEAPHGVSAVPNLY